MGVLSVIGQASRISGKASMLWQSHPLSSSTWLVPISPQPCLCLMLMGKGSAVPLLPIPPKNRLSRCRQNYVLRTSMLPHAVVIDCLSCFIHHLHSNTPPHARTRYNNADTSFPVSAKTETAARTSSFPLLFKPYFASDAPHVRVRELVGFNPPGYILQRQRPVMRGAVLCFVVVTPE